MADVEGGNIEDKQTNEEHASLRYTHQCTCSLCPWVLAYVNVPM